jgi:hypothetical protein
MSKIQDHSDRERPVGSDGLTYKEREVLALTDAGMDRGQIAERTGLKPHRVQSIQHVYADSGRDAWKDSARNGSMMLAAAITQMQARRRPIAVPR